MNRGRGRPFGSRQREFQRQQDEQIRDGVRGGRAYFNWEDVKQDKHRQNYLGHSIFANTSRDQRNRDVFWYARGQQEQGNRSNESTTVEEQRRRERALVQRKEQEMMNLALGLPADAGLQEMPREQAKTESSVEPVISKEELRKLLKREDSGTNGLGAGAEQEEAPHGLGFDHQRFTSVTANAEILNKTHDRLEGTLLAPDAVKAAATSFRSSKQRTESNVGTEQRTTRRKERSHRRSRSRSRSPPAQRRRSRSRSRSRDRHSHHRSRHYDRDRNAHVSRQERKYDR